VVHAQLPPRVRQVLCKRLDLDDFYKEHLSQKAKSAGTINVRDFSSKPPDGRTYSYEYRRFLYVSLAEHDCVGIVGYAASQPILGTR